MYECFPDWSSTREASRFGVGGTRGIIVTAMNTKPVVPLIPLKALMELRELLDTMALNRTDPDGDEAGIESDAPAKCPSEQIGKSEY
jgi:hypothetical protein